MLRFLTALVRGRLALGFVGVGALFVWFGLANVVEGGRFGDSLFTLVVGFAAIVAAVVMVRRAMGATPLFASSDLDERIRAHRAELRRRAAAPGDREGRAGCTSCGHGNEGDAAFCAKCGSAVERFGGA